MASHSSTLAWKLPWTEEPGRLQSMGLLSNFTFTFHFHALEKEMATHSTVLAWRIPAVYGVAQSRTRLKRLSSSSSSLLQPFSIDYHCFWASQGTLVVKNLPASAGDKRGVGWIPGLGRSPGVGKDNPL